MKAVTIAVYSILIFVSILLLTLLVGHVISFAFGQGWALNLEWKNVCAVVGCILSAITCFAYWVGLADDSN